MQSLHKIIESLNFETPLYCIISLEAIMSNTSMQLVKLIVN